MPFLAASLRVLSLTLLLGGLFFLLLPRQAGATRARSSNTMSKHLTGFDEEVALGQLGEILENDSVVMSVEFTDEDRKATRPIGEPLWRGVTLIHYENGRWRRMHHVSLQTIVSLPYFNNKGPNRRQVIRQIIKLEPNDSATLFGLRPMLELSAATRLPPVSEPGRRHDPPSRVPGRLRLRGPLRCQSRRSPGWRDGAVGSQASSRCGRCPRTSGHGSGKSRCPWSRTCSGEGIEAITARARALEGFLRDSREFSYTLQMDVIDRRLDPVEDFLVNRKKGHCEYFASALALLLRSIDIPARLVNGFKGGDWNELTAIHERPPEACP